MILLRIKNIYGLEEMKKKKLLQMERPKRQSLMLSSMSLNWDLITDLAPSQMESETSQSVSQSGVAWSALVRSSAS